MIRFEKVTFGYNTRRILNELSLTIEDGEKMAILGGSGEGKTTILKLIVGLIRPDSGAILIDGEDITGKSEDELNDIRRKFSIVFQQGALFDSLSVKENVAFCLREYAHMTEAQIDEKVRELLRLVDVEPAISLMPDELSGGMHRRVAIARALAVAKPKMMLYDEATAGLDPVNSDNICRLIVELSKTGMGHIMVTHKVVDALKVAERFVFLEGGKPIFDGNADALLQSTHPHIMVFVDELRYRPAAGS
ncbi:MAG TPA: ATP-binding cassette domain-containing protein [Dissulfurispiraceae bacterium]|nr:ATP-binding cassette domain-containing protein [Dissulfurispiraceae bacterium]